MEENIDLGRFEMKITIILSVIISFDIAKKKWQKDYYGKITQFVLLCYPDISSGALVPWGLVGIERYSPKDENPL